MNEKIQAVTKKITIRELIFISVFLHFLVIVFASDGTIIFDERHYVPAARDILNGIPSNLGHPFLGKVWGALGISILGDNLFGWRIPIVIFGILSLIVFYHFSKFFLGEKKALFATALLSIDNIFFIHSSLFLLDVPAIFFAFLGFYLYQKNHLSFAAVSFGLAILCKEWAVLFVLVLFTYHVIISRSKVKITKFTIIKLIRFVGILFLVVIIPLWIYIILYQPVAPGEVRVELSQRATEEDNSENVYVTKTIPENEITNPFEYFAYIVEIQSTITEKYTPHKQFWNNYAWGWIIPYKVDPPIYYQTTINVEKSITEEKETVKIQKHPISWIGIGNFPIWLSIWLIVPFVSYRIITKKSANIDFLIIFWIGFTFFPWFYVSGIMERIVYAFYFINVVPILAIGIPHFIGNVSHNNRNRNIISTIWLSAAVIFFLYYFPVNIFEL